MTYSRLIQIEFNHCDPAGIVFYPRYFEMTNSVVENFFNDVVGRSFAQMHMAADNGVPTVAIEAAFMAPSRLGDKVLFSLKIVKLGRTSVTVCIEGRMGDELRMRATLTLVWIDGMKAAAWPDAMRARLQAYMEDAA
ncbi:MAG: thioesterase superfamily protein [uncultured bacterium]|uniref:acyl-CoA thioesterase n=1 Tax=Cypionkella sp. TaxID=2811411 RepID=UPI000285BAC6|nr:thioesterase family protein [Cypionkella sp.]EKD59583.1 MAG: thioesterase superfamily protein [uncultured bacterium]KAF0173238.1 MAG: thioesterase superfamily protein [Paracoccaceae bacterium]MDO8326834.1 thioesterase family protein [Cypionkella sp.]